MRILFINNDGGGFADYIEVEDGLTVQKLFAQQMGPGKPDNYLIRVNRQPVAADQVLQDGDRVSCSPVKIEGARHRKLSPRFTTGGPHGPVSTTLAARGQSHSRRTGQAAHAIE